MKRLTQIFQALLGVVALILTALIAAGRLAWCTIRNWWKTRSKWLRRSVKTLFVLILVGFVTLIAYICYNCQYGRWCLDKSLSKHVRVYDFHDRTQRVYNKRLDKYTTPKINWVSDAPANDSLAVYAVSNKRGYLSINTGEILIDAAKNNYGKAWVFSEGLAAVENGGKIGFINIKNEVVIPFQFDYSDKHNMYNLAYLFHNGYCVMTNIEGKLGLIDKMGNWVVAPEYSQLWAPQERGYRVVIKGEKYGMLDSSLNLIYDTSYDYIGNHSETGGFILMKEGRMWQEDYEGNVVQSFMFESSEMLSYPVNQEKDEYSYTYNLSDFSKYRISGKYGIMNRITGRPITLAIYDNINMISSNMFEVSSADNYGYYLIDTKGNEVKR